MRDEVVERFTAEFGPASRERVKVKSWDLQNDVGVVVQMDQPSRANSRALVWLPYPSEGQLVPEIALEYPGEAGRHSGTYPAAGLKRGNPALRLSISNALQLDDVVKYIHAMTLNAPLPNVADGSRITNNGPRDPITKSPVQTAGSIIDPASMPKVEAVKPRREAIPRLVQREVWQRDGGRCVECSTRERLCFDHIVPFSRGGSNSVRNLQLLCESCNLSKSNRL